MEKINIAEILKDCPIGTKLYSPLCGECKLDTVTCKSILVESITFKTLHFNEDGTYYEGYDDAECLLFPSKENRDWSKFQRPFKDGDIIYTDNFIAILSNITEDGAVCYHCYYCISTKKFKAKRDFGIGNINYDEFRIATEEEKSKLFQAIKDNGYKWNSETKTLEKLINPKFEEGDEIEKCGYRFTIAEVKDNYYLTKCGNKIPIDYQDDFSLVPNKSDITTLKPFDKVLVRDSDNGIWCASIFSHTWIDRYFCVGTWHNQCIPYEGNEHLLGTTKNCDEYFKTWK